MSVATLSAPQVRARAAGLSWAAAGLMAAGSGALLAASYALHPLWWAAWVAPIPLLAAALAGPARRVRGLGALAGALGGMTTFGYYAAVTGWPVAVGLCLARALLWSELTHVAVRSARRLPARVAVFAMPALAAALETLVLNVSPHGTYGSFAYSQMAALPVIQLAALGGAPAIVFVVLCFGTLAGLAAGQRLGAPIDARGLALAAGLVAVLTCATVAYGEFRLASPASGREVEFALVATDRFTGEPHDWPAVWARYRPAVEAGSSPGAVVVLPEKIAVVSTSSAAEAARDLGDVARTRGETVTAGVEVHGDDGSWVNRALVAGPDGRVATYDKRRLVPGLEARDRPGSRSLLVQAGGVRTGVAICKDMHFPGIGRDYARAGAGLVLTPAWDFVRDGWMSDRLTTLRGVEGGYAIARATREGVSSVSDRFGRVLGEMRSGPAVSTLRVRARLERQAHPTLYARVGDAFGWIAAFLAIGLLLRMPSSTASKSTC